MICHYNLKPNSETFRSMISLNVKIKDVSCISLNFLLHVFFWKNFIYICFAISFNLLPYTKVTFHVVEK